MTRKLVEEWIYKEEEDFESAVHLVKKDKKAVPDSVCFHCQQCIEKYLKAFLISNDIEPPEIHDLQRLKVICSKVDESFEEVSGELDILNAYAVNFRYPGEVATVEEANEAVLVMRKIHKFIRDRLKLEQ
ncbi:HEPN domain-containing protein [bacterium]|nr:HEPN domain-containing protein [bacterium]